ncbi:MAG: dodecin family protein [Acidimicrobiales bacterium]
MATPMRFGEQFDVDSVYKVIQLVGSHPDSWEAAAEAALQEAMKTIRDLRVAQVIEMDTHLLDGVIHQYRVRLKVSFRVDRGRRAPTGERVEVRRYLVVANQTTGGAELNAAIEKRVAAGPSEFHVLVPATWSKDYAAARRLTSLGVDPASGFAVADLSVLNAADEEGERIARERLDRQLAQLRSVGAHPTGEVGPADPIGAIAAVLSRGSFDEIILSTLHASASRWLRMDLPSRVERRFGLPVTVIESER